jgi:predicted ATPase
MSGGRNTGALRHHIKGELVLREGAPNASAVAEDHFRNSLDLARRHSVLLWELRTATSFARLQRDRGDASAARDVLRPIYGRFTEGFGTADLKAASLLLDELA